ncbi:hypothetical protein L3X38_039445 [Prunus dulcis]|uniref:Uncharacterized protein n=1 Tax=Prunus dulcis TaxID=3755 RepID=A0AAD4V8M1_PRUDU|nr:hypothetical protein L3X38_039445 [Prunus dulcis]
MTLNNGGETWMKHLPCSKNSRSLVSEGDVFSFGVVLLELMKGNKLDNSANLNVTRVTLQYLEDNKSDPKKLSATTMEGFSSKSSPPVFEGPAAKADDEEAPDAVSKQPGESSEMKQKLSKTNSKANTAANNNIPDLNLSSSSTQNPYSSSNKNK